MRLPHSSLARFVVGVLPLLAGTLLVWWLALDHLLIVLLWMVNRLSQLLLAEQVIVIQAVQEQWQILTTFSSLNDPLAFKSLAFDPRRYSVGLPLLWALVLATPGARRGWNLAAGSVLLAAVIVLMLLAETLFQLLLAVGPRPIMVGALTQEYLLALPFSRTAAYGISLARQFAVIMTPAAPLVIWAFLNGPFIQSVISPEVMSRLRRRVQRQ